MIIILKKKLIEVGKRHSQGNRPTCVQLSIYLYVYTVHTIYLDVMGGTHSHHVSKIFSGKGLRKSLTQHVIVSTKIWDLIQNFAKSKIN